jgi:hypothetical protein
MVANAAGAVYGTILVSTLLSAESARQETYAKTVLAVIIALLAYWLTISYSEYAGERFERGERFEYGAFGRTAVHEVALLAGAALPLLVLLIFWAVGVALTTAVTIDIFFAAATIVATEVLIGIRAELTGRELIRQSAVGALLGLLVISLRLLLH